ncbi:MAG: PD40 domain-containing protein [Bacteroidetes bacterium]|nr:PD40 domain-containing protein [Fibrella sp.]
MADFVANAQVSGYTVEGGKRRSSPPLRGNKGRKKSWSAFFSSLLPFFLLLSSPSFGQDPKALALYNQGIKLFSERKTAEALPFLEQAVKQDPTFAEGQLKLGQLYEFSRQPEPALAAYQQTIRLQPDKPTSAPAYQAAGNLLMRQGRYGEAIPYLEKFGTLFPPNSGQAQRVKRMLDNARFGQQAVQNPQLVTPKAVSESLQTTPSQYFPVLTADEQTIVFTVLKPEGDEDLFTSSFTGEGWAPPVSLSTEINTRDNEGTPSLSADGRTLVFTACQGRKGFGSCDLYITHKTGDDWATPENIGPAVNTHHWESQPSLSADGRRLYFVSDRPGGVGRRDIWRTDIDTAGNWQKPVNLGKPVNTPFNEASPFIHANGQSLFFASEGHTGLGGYDLFVSGPRQAALGQGASNPASQADSSGAVWDTPLNLGYPINNADDQAALFVAANGTKAYYSYEEQKEGVSQKSRLYTFDLPENLRDRVTPVSYLKGIIADARTKKPLPATVELIDLKTNQTVTRITADARTGQYTAVLPSGGEYALYVSTPGYLFKSLSFDFTQKSKGDKMALPVSLEPIGPTSRETLNNLFFESSRYDLGSKSRTELERLATFMQQNPTVGIEVTGHTDDQGDAAANLTLSQKRAQSVVGYLTKAGIAPARIKAVGYGKTRPLVPNTTDENRQQNRRIEWRIL